MPTQQRRLFDDEIDTDLSFDEKPAATVEGGLSEREESILTFEKQWWRQAGTKEQAIKDKFDLSGTRYYQILNSLLDKPEALEHDPVLVARLRRLRGSRARTRGASSSGT
ncbi:MAG TPA: DUF3263 domain-containing protein [Micromonosporaceae bacterium]|nr:DUF3263 domain-containing protein [Micromonosporaceae bacterium]